MKEIYVNEPMRFGGITICQVRTGASFSADKLVSSPRKFFIFMNKKKKSGSQYPKKTFCLILKTEVEVR